MCAHSILSYLLLADYDHDTYFRQINHKRMDIMVDEGTDFMLLTCGPGLFVRPSMKMAMN